MRVRVGGGRWLACRPEVAVATHVVNGRALRQECLRSVEVPGHGQRATLGLQTITV